MFLLPQWVSLLVCIASSILRHLFILKTKWSYFVDNSHRILQWVIRSFFFSPFLIFIIIVYYIKEYQSGLLLHRESSYIVCSIFISLDYFYYTDIISDCKRFFTFYYIRSSDSLHSHRLSVFSLCILPLSSCLIHSLY